MNEAEKTSANLWKQKFGTLCRAFGLAEISPENTDTLLEQALQHVAALKHLVIEHAAYGCCDCEHTKAQDKGRFCDYCLACHMRIRLGEDWTEEDERRFTSFHYHHFLTKSIEVSKIDEPEEQVLCFARYLLSTLGEFQGLTLAVGLYTDLLKPESALYVPRASAETNTMLKQLIPFMIVVKDDKIFRYRRGSKGGEALLHGKWTVGTGGHLNIQDGSYEQGMLRELKEEIGAKWVSVSKPVAMINDDSTEVGRVHFGVVHIVHIAELGDLEKGVIEQGEFVSVEDLGNPLNIDAMNEYESWARLCVAEMPYLIARAKLYKDCEDKGLSSNIPGTTA